MNQWTRLVEKHRGLMTRYPYILPRIATNYFKLMVLKKPVLRGVEFSVSNDCNAACGHCSAWELMEAKGDVLDVATSARILGECIELGALNINFTGGEALMRREIYDLIGAAQPDRVVVSLATNGMMLSDDVVRRLKESGVRILSVGLDSARPDVHDARKARVGAYERLIAGVKRAVALDLEVYLCTVITRENLANGDAWEMVELSRNLGCLLTVNIACSVGAWKDDQDQLLRQHEIRAYERMLEVPHVRWEGGSNYLKEGCPAGIEKIYVTATGEVAPCPRAHVSFGNARTEPMHAIWRRMLGEEAFGHVQPGCPAGDDPQFIQTYLEPIRESGQSFLPVDEIHRRNELKTTRVSLPVAPPGHA